MSQDDEILTPEVCQLLEVDRSTITRWVKAGRLAPTRKLPGRTGAFLFRRRDVERLARQVKAGAA